MLPVVRTLQKYWPKSKLTWIIGKNEASLVNDISGIEFIEFDKSRSIRSYVALSQKMKHRNFDVLLCAQVALRANIIAALIPATIKLGYDKARAKDFHSLFINQYIKAAACQHVLDSFFGFIEHLGLNEREMHWNYVIPDQAQAFANQYLMDNRFKVIISPCSRHADRNWAAERYAGVADHAIQSLDAQVVLCGGPSETEKKLGLQIERYMKFDALNLIGKSSLKELLALLKNADVIISPDSGPAHIATGLGTPVIGLYAATDPKRSGPYLSQQWCVDRHDDAARTFRNKSASELKWGAKLTCKGVMDLISVEEVISKLEQLSRQQ